MNTAADSTPPPRPPHGSKQRSCLEVAPGAALPLLVVRGARQGAVLAVTAGIHGDEYEGVRAIFEVFEALDPALLSGTWIAVPVANPPAFWKGTRTSPDDGANLARTFPGKPGGSVSERIAWRLAHDVIARADFFLDLHSGGVLYRMPSMVGYDDADERSRRAALAFGAPVLWGHREIPDGRTISFARDRGIPWLYTEARGAGRIDAADLAMMRRGMLNLMMHLGILPGTPEPFAPAMRLTGDGNIDAAITASRAGFLLSGVGILDSVARGARLGTLVDLQGNTVEEYFAPFDGVLGLVREFPVVQPGDSVYLLAKKEAV
jgi:predicted deacylase